MSKPRPDLPNSVSAANKVIERYVGSGLFNKVFIAASRSPNSSKQARPESDWDFYFISNKPNVRIPSLRETNQLHGDIVVIYEGNMDRVIRSDLVEIYPTDKYGVLNENA